MITPQELVKAKYEFVQEQGLFIWYKQSEQEQVVFLEQARSSEPKGPQVGVFSMLTGSQPNRQVFEHTIELNDKSKLAEVEGKMSNFKKACSKI